MRENPSSKLNYTTSLRNLLITYNLRIGFVVHILSLCRWTPLTRDSAWPPQHSPPLAGWSNDDILQRRRNPSHPPHDRPIPPPSSWQKYTGFIWRTGSEPLQTLQVLRSCSRGVLGRRPLHCSIVTLLLPSATVWWLFRIFHCVWCDTADLSRRRCCP